MSDVGGSFQGTGVIVWFHDGKQHSRLFEDNDEWRAEVERLDKLMPNRMIYCAIINWDNRSVYSFHAEQKEEENGPVN